MELKDQQQIQQFIDSDANNATFEKRIQLPLIENFIMGISLFILILVTCFFFMSFNDITIRDGLNFTKQATLAISFSGFLGIIFFTILNLFRFGKDEWRIWRLAYKLGKLSNQSKIYQLQQIVTDKQFEQIPNSTIANQLEDCLKLLKIQFSNGKLSRTNRPQGMSEQQYNKARQLLITNKVIAENNALLITDFHQAATIIKNSLVSL